MRRIFKLSFFILLFTLLWTGQAYAASYIDTGNVQKGIVTIKYTGDFSKTVRVVVQKGSTSYQYDIASSNVNLPLQMGAGKYDVTLCQQVSGSNYKVLEAVKLDVPNISDKALYTNSIINVNYSPSMKAISDFNSQLKSAASDADRMNIVYNFLVKELNYDHEKAKSVANANNYVPVLDSIYNSKKGICYDYSALLAGVLRSAGVPVKLVMGYAPGVTEYHAWNEVLVGGKWVVLDTTTDSQLEKANQSYQQQKDGSKFKVVKYY